MPPRKRKAPAAEETVDEPQSQTTTSKTKPTNSKTTTKTTSRKLAAASQPARVADTVAVIEPPVAAVRINAVHAVVKKAQTSEAFHTKYTKELTHIYERLGHEQFIPDYRDTIQQLLLCEDAQIYATAGLRFLAKFATSYNTVDTHPLLVYTFDWLLDTVSVSPIIRFRICQFVNLLLNALSNDAALDFAICENIVKYMVDRMKDVSPTVRVQALNAMQRLQSPDDREDKIFKIYQLHLNADPSALVRQAVITSICRNQHTIPFILDRFWDVDDKVRRHAYLHMCTYSVKSYRVVQRLQFIEQGLHDHSESVRKVVTNVLLPAWLEAYNRDYIQFVAALKLDANEADIERFQKAARLALMAIFKKQRVNDLIDSLPLHTADTDAELAKCIPLDKLSVESALYWHTLLEYVRSVDEEHGSDELDRILPEMSTFCVYITRYFELVNVNVMDKWQRLEHHYVLQTLCEIIDTFDMSDELGRNRLRQLLCEMLAREQLDETIVAKAVHCLDRVVPDVNDRLQLVADTIRTVVDANSVPLDLSSAAVVELLGRDSNLNFRVSSMKLRIMELEEQERDCITQKEYGRAEKLRGELNECSDALATLIAQHLRGEGDNGTAADGTSSAESLLPQLRRVSIEDTIRCIQMACHVVRSPTVRSLNPAMVRVFKDFIRRHMEGKHMNIRDHALKCGISFAMLYEQLAKDVYAELFAQFFKHTQTQIWATAISGIIELIDRYGFEHFEDEHSENGESEAGSNATSGMTGTGNAASRGAHGGSGSNGRYAAKNMTRQLYSSNLDNQDGDGDGDLLMQRRNADIMLVLDHFLDDCAESFIQRALIDGYCRLLLRGYISGSNYVSRMLLKYFNPMTEPEITQILGIFFEKLIALHRQECLQEAMLTTLFTVLDSPPESPLQEIQPESILRFVITSTRPMNSSPGLNIHNTIAMSFLDVMSDNTDNKELLRLLAKAFTTLDVAVDDVTLRRDLFTGLDQLLDGNRLEPRTETSMRLFKQRMVSAAEESDVRLTGTFCSTANALPAIAENGDDQNNDVDEEVHDRTRDSGDDEENAKQVQDTAEKRCDEGLPSETQSPNVNNKTSPTTPERPNSSVVVPETPSPLAISPINSQRTINNNEESINQSRRSSTLRKSRSSAMPTNITTRNATSANEDDGSKSARLSSSYVDENDDTTSTRKTTRSRRVAAATPATTRTTRGTTTTKVNVDARQTAVRSKRRNDMMAKSPSPRSLSTVSKQTSKKSRIVTPNGSLARSTATAASLTTANPSKSVVAAAPLSCRRNLERLRDGHTRLINDMTAKHIQTVVLEASKETTPKRATRHRLEPANLNNSPTKPTSKPTTPAAAVRNSLRSAKSSPSKQATSSTQSRSSDSDRSPAKIRPTVRSALPLRVAASRPVIASAASTSASSSSTLSDTEHKNTNPIKYPHVKLHRLGQPSRSQRPGNNETARPSTGVQSATSSVAASVGHRTRGAIAQEFIQNNIITRNRRSVENLLSLTRPRRSLDGSGKSPAANSTQSLAGKQLGRNKATDPTSAIKAMGTSSRDAPLIVKSSPLRSSNGVTATAAISQRGTRIPRPTKK